MKLSRILIGCVVLFFVTHARLQSQIFNWEWAYHLGGAGYEEIHSIDVGPTGLIAVGGTMSNTFLPMGTNLLSCPGINSRGFFFGVFNENGTPKWGLVGVGSGFSDIACNAVRFDPNGNIVSAGTARSSTPDSLFPTSNGRDICIVKTDSLGNWIWSSTAGKISVNDLCNDMEVDQLGNIYIVGNTNQGATFGSLTASTTGWYIAKLNSQGTFQWLKCYAGSYPEAIAVDANGGIYAAVTFTNTVIYNGQSFNAIFGDALVFKFDSSSGNLLWTRQITGTGYESISDMASTSNGKILVGGRFSADVVAGSQVAVTYGNSDCFLALLDANGNFLQLTTFGGFNNEDYLYDIRTDSNDQFWVSGEFTVEMWMNGIYHNQGNQDALFVASWDSTLQFEELIIEGLSSPSNGEALPYGLAINNNNIWIGGSMVDNVSLPPFQLFSPSNRDLLIAKAYQCQPPTLNLLQPSVTTLCSGDSITLSVTGQGGSDLQWYENGFAINGATQASYTTNNTGSFYVIGADGPACTDTSNSIVIQSGTIPYPMIIANGIIPICDDGSVTMYTSQPFSSYSWSNGFTTPTITATQSGVYSLTVTSGDGCEGTAAPFIVTSYPPVVVPTIMVSNCSLSVSPTGYFQYKWFRDGQVIPGVNASSYISNQAGNYYVQVMDSNGCWTTSFSVQVNCPVVGMDDSLLSGLQVFPQPASDYFDVVLGGDFGDISGWMIRDVLGRILAQGLPSRALRIDCSGLTTGCYFLEIESMNGVFVRKISVLR